MKRPRDSINSLFHDEFISLGTVIFQVSMREMRPIVHEALENMV